MKRKYLSLLLVTLALITIVVVITMDYQQSRLLSNTFQNVEELQHAVIVGLVSSTILLFIAFALAIFDQVKIEKVNRKLSEELKDCNDKLVVANDRLEEYKNKLLTRDAAQCQEAEQKILEANSKLEQANEGLKRANDELTAFYYSISHDLRAPLRAITGFSEILTEEYHKKFDESGKKALNIIQHNASRMGELINDLLQLAKLGNLSVSKQQFDMCVLVKQVLDDKILKANTKLTVLPMDNAYADSGLLRQVWENLISNAIKFSSKTDVPVIEIGYQTQNGDQLYWIRDNGVGFDPSYADKLFKVFSRLHAKKEFEGTGAGLAITKKIIDAHGGRIWSEAQLSKGATFYFTLPLNRD